MKTTYVNIPAGATATATKTLMAQHRLRLGAFFAEKCGTEWNNHNMEVYRFYAPEKLRRITPTGRKRQLAAIDTMPVATRPDEQCTQQQDRHAMAADMQITNMNEQEAIIYGNSADIVRDDALKEFLDRHHLTVVETFYDADMREAACDYPEFQKAAFFARRMKAMLVISSAEELIDNIRFLNLLKDTGPRFYCVDFPWLCRENIDLFRALALYKSGK